MAIACEQIRSEFSALLDEELNSEDRELVEEHLSECADCLRDLHSYQQVNDAYRYHHPVKAPDDFEDRLRVAMAPPKENVHSFPVYRRYAAAAVVLLGMALTGWRLFGPSEAPMLLSQNEVVGGDEMAAEEGMQERKLLEESVAMDGVAAVDDRSKGLAGAPSAGFNGGGGGKGGLGGGGGFGAAHREMDVPSDAPEMTRQQEAKSKSVNDGVENIGALSADSSMEPAASDAMPEPLMEQEAPVSTMRESLPAASPAPMPSAPPAEAPVAMDEKQDFGRVATFPMKDAAESPVEESRRSGVRKVSPESDSVSATAPPTVARKMADGEAVARAPRRENAALSEEAMQKLVWRNLEFKVLDGVLQQHNYGGETVTVVAVPSDAWTTLLEASPDLSELVDGTRHVIVMLGETWYRLEPASADTSE